MVKVFSSNEENESVSTPFCSHKFSKTCWTSHLSNLLEGNNNGEERVLCPNPDCVAPVGPDTMKNNQRKTKVNTKYENTCLKHNHQLRGKKHLTNKTTTYKAPMPIKNHKTLNTRDQSFKRLTPYIYTKESMRRRNTT
ncbi:hypothetical protein YC2023_041595 [Brassica napus]